MGGPKPPPPGSKGAKLAARMPTTRVVPTVDQVIRNAYSVIQAEIHAMGRRTALTVESGKTEAMAGADVRNLLGLLQSLKICKELDEEAEKSVGALLGKATDAELLELAKGEAGEPDDA